MTGSQTLRIRAGLIIPLGALLFSTGVAAKEPRPEELIGGLGRYIALFQRVRFRVIEKMYTSYPDYPVNYLYRKVRATVLIDGNRRKESSSTTVWPLVKGNPIETTEQHEWVAGDDEMCFLVTQDPKTGEANGTMAASGLTEQERKRRTGIWVALPLIDDTIGGDPFPLPELLRRSKSSVRKEQFEGQDAWALSATSEWANYTIWLDPKRSFVPLRIFRRQEGWHKDAKGIPLHSVSVKKGGPWYESTYDWRAKRVENVQGRPVVTEYSIVASAVRGENKARDTDRQLVTLADVTFSPHVNPDSFRISIPVPDGTPATVKGKEMIRHEWRGGRVVKCVHQDSVANLEGNWFQGGRGWGVGLMGLAGLAAVGVGFYWWRRGRAVTS